MLSAHGSSLSRFHHVFVLGCAHLFEVCWYCKHVFMCTSLDQSEGINPWVNLKLVGTAALEPGKMRRFSPHGTLFDEHSSPTWRWRKWQLPIVMDWFPFVSVCSCALRHAVVVDVCVDECVRAPGVCARWSRSIGAFGSFHYDYTQSARRWTSHL